MGLARGSGEGEIGDDVVIILRACQRLCSAGGGDVGERHDDLGAALYCVVESDGKEQATTFGSRDIGHGHCGAVVVGDGARGGIGIGDQSVERVEVDGERFGTFHHEVVERVDGKLLGLACGSGEGKVGDDIVVILWRFQRWRSAGGGDVGESYSDLGTALHCVVESHCKEQATTFGSRDIDNCYCRVVVVGNGASSGVGIGDQNIERVEVDCESFATFQHRVVERVDGKLLGLACGAGEGKIGDDVVIILRARQRRRSAGGGDVGERHDDLGAALHCVVESHCKEQVSTFGGRDIGHGHCSAVVISDGACGGIGIGDQNVECVEVDCESFATFQHRVVERVDGKLLGLARGAGEGKIGDDVVIILRARQRWRSTCGREVGERHDDLGAALHCVVESDGEEQATTFGSRDIGHGHRSAVVISDGAGGGIGVSDQNVERVEVDCESFATFQHRVVERVDGKLLGLARGAGEGKIGDDVVIILRARQRWRSACGRDVGERHDDLGAAGHGIVESDGEN